MVETRCKQTRFRAQILKIEYHCPTCCASFQNPQPSLAENKPLFQQHAASRCSSSCWKLQSSYKGARPESALSLADLSDFYYPGGCWGRGRRSVQDIKALESRP